MGGDIIKTTDVRVNDELNVLIEKGKKGDEEAVRNIIERYKGLIIKEAAKYRIPAHSFEDVVQYGYLTVIKCIRSYNYGKCAFNGYVITAIKNNFGYLLRSNIKHYNEVPDNCILNKAEGLSISIEDHMIAYEEVKELYKAIDQLSYDERAVIENYYIKGINLKEYASVNGINYNTIIYRKKKAIGKLKKLLKELR